MPAARKWNQRSLLCFGKAIGAYWGHVFLDTLLDVGPFCSILPLRDGIVANHWLEICDICDANICTYTWTLNLLCLSMNERMVKIMCFEIASLCCSAYEGFCNEWLSDIDSSVTAVWF